MTLVENAKESWKWFSMQAMTGAGALQGAWVAIPQDLRDNVPQNLVHYITLGLVILGVAGRLIKQKSE